MVYTVVFGPKDDLAVGPNNTCFNSIMNSTVPCTQSETCSLDDVVAGTCSRRIMTEELLARGMGSLQTFDWTTKMPSIHITIGPKCTSRLV